MIESDRLAAIPGLRHGLTTQSDGSIGPGGDSAAQQARRRATIALGADPARLVTGHQVHGSTVALVGSAQGGSAALPATDGLATADVGTVLMVQGADCPLVLVVDPAARALAVAHSGWRGTVASIGARAVDALTQIGARPERLVATVFPGIGPCCFEVGPEVVAAFVASHGQRATDWRRPSPGSEGRSLFDLPAAIAATLTDAGVPAVERIAGCTVCDGRLFSHRASRGGPGRHGLFAALV